MAALLQVALPVQDILLGEEEVEALVAVVVALEQEEQCPQQMGLLELLIQEAAVAGELQLLVLDL